MSDASKSLADMRHALSELNRMMKRLGGELGPVWDHEAALKEEIGATHGGPGRFNPDGAPERAPKFDALTDSVEKNGAAKAEYTRIKKLANAYMREAEMIERQILKAKPKGK